MAARNSPLVLTVISSRREIYLDRREGQVPRKLGRPGADGRLGSGRVLFADAVPCRRDRWELRHRLRAVARQQRAELKQEMAGSLRRLATGRVLLTSISPGPGGDEELAFADGTRMELAVRDGNFAVQCLTASPQTPCYLAKAEPCSGYFWYWLQFFAPGLDDLTVLVRVDRLESAGTRLARPLRRWWPGHHPVSP